MAVKLALRAHLSGTSILDIGVGITRRPSDDEVGNNTGSDVNSDNAWLPWERFRNLISIAPLQSHNHTQRRTVQTDTNAYFKVTQAVLFLYS